MAPQVSFCTARIVPQPYAGLARERAIAENPANIVSSAVNPAFEAAGETRKFWRPGRALKVTFLGGDSAVQQQVMSTARKWSDFAHIAFDFSDHENADIRIALDENDGHWSAVGTDALVAEFFRPGEATMNCALTTDSPAREYSRVVLHEFGHALGLIHEHQNPAAGIEWNERVVIDDLTRSQGWDLATIRHNVLDAARKDDITFTDFDDKSIMLYAFPVTWTLNGKQFADNTTLSEIDKAFIAARYPKEAPDAN